MKIETDGKTRLGDLKDRKEKWMLREQNTLKH